MKYILVIAFKNLFRHRNRNLMIGLGIAFSAGLLFFILSLALGIEEQLITNLINTESGAITVVPEHDFLTHSNADSVTTYLNERVETITGIPGVVAIRQRVHANAFLYFDNNSERINLKGIESTSEQDLLFGLRFQSDSVPKLTSAGGIFISESLATKLNMNTGDMCNIMAQTIQGTLNLYDFYIAGIYTNLSGWTNTIVYADINNVKSLYNTTHPTNLLIDIKNLSKVHHIAAQIDNTFKVNTSVSAVVVKPYTDSLGITHVVANANRYSFLSIVFFIQLMSFIGIVFLVLNNLMERNNEVGTLLAIGFTPWIIRIMFITESFFIALIASTAGVLIFYFMVIVLSVHGLDLGESASIVFGNSTIKPVFALNNFLLAIVIGIIYPLLSAYFGTRRIHKIEPIDALRVRAI